MGEGMLSRRWDGKFEVATPIFRRTNRGGIIRTRPRIIFTLSGESNRGACSGHQLSHSIRLFMLNGNWSSGAVKKADLVRHFG